MRLNPVNRYPSPGFPTRRIIDEHPELLALVPQRWQGNPVVIAALTGVCLLMASSRSQAVTKAKSQVASRVAPVFIHGDGRGSFGCIAVSPPVFLSEVEARQIIVEEAKRGGIDFEPDVRTLPDSVVTFSAPTPVSARVRDSLLKLDGSDERRNISYEYVSRQDYADWRGWSTTGFVDAFPVARRLREGLIVKRPSGTYVLFYDPASDPPADSLIRYPHPNVPGQQLTPRQRCENCDARSQAAKAVDAEQLRAQVRDFITWLKAQGVI